MKAIVRTKFGGPDVLKVQEVDTPRPEAGEVLVRVKAFGLNRAELYMRKGVWGDVAQISGIECVGEVEDDPSGDLPRGQAVFAIMGGMGRTRNGSYAEYVCVPSTNVVAVHSGLDWPSLAALPESYATAWYCLNKNMGLKPGARILIRGGTSALGQAAINIAANVPDTHIVATSRKPQREADLRALGASDFIIEKPDLHNQIRAKYPDGLDGVLDIIGNTTLLDSLKIARTGGVVCTAGFLGGGDPIPFNPLMDMPSCVNLNFFASFMFGTPGFSLSDIPFDDIIRNVETGIYKARPAEVFAFSDIAKAHTMMEANTAAGKLVVAL